MHTHHITVIEFKEVNQIHTHRLTGNYAYCMHTHHITVIEFKEVNQIHAHRLTGN